MNVWRYIAGGYGVVWLTERRLHREAKALGVPYEIKPMTDPRSDR